MALLVEVLYTIFNRLFDFSFSDEIVQICIPCFDKSSDSFIVQTDIPK